MSRLALIPALIPALILALILALLPPPALADGAVPVALPQLPSADEAFYDRFLTRLVTANVISSNCAGFGITDGEWGLLTGTVDLIAGQMGLDAGPLDDGYYAPAFALLNWDGACAKYGPDVRPVIDLLIDMGGVP